MELYLEQQEFSAFQLVSQRAAEERFSSDCVVPDSLPDASRLLFTEGELCLWRLDLADGSAELEGEIRSSVCFQAENGDVSGFPVSVPVSVRFRGEELQSGQRPCLSCRVSELTGQMINSRKIRLQGRLTCDLKLYAPGDYLFTTGVGEEEKGVFQRREHTSVSVVSAVEEQVFSVSETLPLRLGFPADGRVLSHSSVPILDETQIFDSRLILQGRVVTTLLYQDAQSGELVSESVETPYSQLMDVSSDQPLSAADAVIHLTSAELRCCNDDQAVETSYHLVVQAVCFSDVEADCVTDAYSTRGSLSLSWAEESVPSVPSLLRRETTEGVLPCVPSGKTVLAARSALRGSGAEITLLLREGETLSTLTGQIPLPDGAKHPLLPETPTIVPGPEGFAVRLPVVFQEASPPAERLRQISGAVIEPLDELDLRPSVKLVRRSDTDLWTLAKAHASSEAAILAANPETESPSNWLLIPRVI